MLLLNCIARLKLKTRIVCFEQFVGVEAFCTTLVDLWPRWLRRGYRREMLFGVTCVAMFICGLPMVTYVSSFMLFLPSIECFARR